MMIHNKMMFMPSVSATELSNKRKKYKENMEWTYKKKTKYENQKIRNDQTDLD
jgi:hypothetical protein